ncbi:MgtC/SapB family protein [Hydrocarboniclastica marina]|uniref:MgtC/SapB family protein n=1 Tax=Hydrocarboniclastica marina TaxID=2259620 RepID=A0A4P7XJC6_9ALTE|nr:MgtC/SapB family protein [Hydrocarboniclastica marina]QCF27148.1 MgtC/SapB family protein [Hydrocarboniclastica marina]
METAGLDWFDQNTTLLRLGLAILLGALIGLQRGWQNRELRAGGRVAGLRTHALTGLLGGFAALLSLELTPWVLPAFFLAVVAIGLMGYRLKAAQSDDYSITGLIGLCLTFCFGSAALLVDPAIPAAAAVVTALILDNKAELHGLLAKLEERELDAALKLLLITVVLLPILPNQGYGPGGVLNPFEIWWLVVLIASISFVGYFAMRIGGTEKGLLFTSFFAGLSSSTALTLHLSRLGRDNPGLKPLLAAGILIACGTMFPRILIYCALINPDLLPVLLWPVALMTVLLYLPAAWLWRRHRGWVNAEQPRHQQNPLDLKSALWFGALLTVILLLGHLLQEGFGDAGVYLLAAVSGVTDVDAITLSLTRLSQESLSAETAILGIVIAATVNNLVKTGLAAGIGGWKLGRLVAGPMVIALAGGLVLAGWLALG